MNWKQLFKYIIDNCLIDTIIQRIENNRVFSFSDTSFEIYPLDENDERGVEYDFKSEHMFNIKFRDEIVTVGHKFLLDSFKSQKLKKELLKNNTEDFTFFDFQFVLYMHFAADVSSGFTHFRNSVKEISNSLNSGKANLNGIWIENDDELNTYLKQHIDGFENLFQSVKEIKKYA